MAATIEKWLHQTRRITHYYVARVNHDVLTISHEPLGLYRQTRQLFFEDRAEAYSLIAKELLDHVHTVLSESVWIDYESEGWQVAERRNTPMKRLVAVWFFWANIENWRREPGPSWYAIGHLTYREASMTREQFATRFGKEGA